MSAGPPAATASEGATARASDNLQPRPLHDKEKRAQLLPREIFWRNHQPWLEQNGYMLRPRFRAGWEPSWKKIKDPEITYFESEDGQVMLASHILDATKISTGEIVILKKISKSVHPYEVEISLFFSTEPLASHPRNHCVPIYDVLDLPDEPDMCLLVMPLLKEFDDPRIKSIGEAVEFFRQVFEGLQFMHQCHVAHRDCMNLNIMMDPKPTFPKLFHPVNSYMQPDFKSKAEYHTRTARPTKYLLIDFGLSRKYNPEDGPPREDIILGGDKTVPEFQRSNEPCDPFPTDVYYIGNMIREDFLQKTCGVEFMTPLVDDMVQDDPSKRPAMDEVVERFKKIVATLSWWQLRSRLVYNEEESFEAVVRRLHHFFRTAAHVLLFRSPIPSP